jgi:3-oxoacyl-[acyl-carrier-protein] synthase-3
MLKPFVVNRHGRLVFPSNFYPELDFTVFDTVDQFQAVIKRDFESKAPSGVAILERIEANGYTNRYELLRDMALRLLWVNRYSITMFVKRPTRWRDVPRNRDDMFLPVVTPWPGADTKIAGVEVAYRKLPPAWNAATEDALFTAMFDIYRHRRHRAAELPVVMPTMQEVLANPANVTVSLPTHDPDYPVYTRQEILDAKDDVPELEALKRWQMVIHNQHPWERSQSRLTPVGELDGDDFVILFQPRNSEVVDFIRRVRAGSKPRRSLSPLSPETRKPVRPYPPLQVKKAFRVMPRIESLATVSGEHACTNDDLIRNTAYNWSPMSAAEIAEKTGIEARRYTARDLDEIALEAALGALAKSGRKPEEIGAVLFASCTIDRLIPSIACWLSGQLGIFQTHASCDIVAACAGMPYGLSEAVRLLQEVERPVLVVFAEKFSDKIGSVRTSRMIFGDGAAAMVIAPAPAGAEPDIEVLQTYASGPVSEVNAILWPNPEFDNDITVWGPEVKNLVNRYLRQMIDELVALPGPDGQARLLDAVDLVVPHQANKMMVIQSAGRVGIKPDKLYFNIERVGNASSASIALAIADAVREGVIGRKMRIFAPGFGAGAVGGYSVLQIDPAIVASASAFAAPQGTQAPAREPGSSSEDVRKAFGE